MKKRGGLVIVLAVQLLATGCSGNRRQAGTGDVAFRLLWDGLSDLDLMVQEPSGECLSFWAYRSPSGGVLDVDCNGSTEKMCERPIENVFWPPSTAPAGDYKFWINAHSVVPGEAPISFELQILRGKEVVWTYKESMQEVDETQGPFVYHFPVGGAAVVQNAQAPVCGPFKALQPTG